MNSNFNNRRIIINCMNTDLKNEHIKMLMGQLGGILLGIGIGKGIAVCLDLSSPDIPFAIIAALVAAGLVFCTQQILMQPVQITIFPDDIDQFEIHKDCLCWNSRDVEGKTKYIHSLFAGKFSAVQENPANNGTIRFRFSGKPSRELIHAVKEIYKNQSRNALYLFQLTSFVLECDQQSGVKSIYRTLAKEGIPLFQEDTKSLDNP